MGVYSEAFKGGINMSKLSTKKITTIAILTALYVVLSAFLKIPIVGNISIDLGYIVFAVGCSLFGPWGAFIGAIGCGLESILFSAYGFSIGWFVANLIIGLGCGFIFQKTEKIWIRIIAIIVFVAIGMLGTKTFIECALYNLPIGVKLVKSFTAFLMDSATMIIGIFIIKYFDKKIHI